MTLFPSLHMTCPRLSRRVLCVATFFIGATPALAQVPIDVPNYSFELPQTSFATGDADVWQETGPGVLTLDTGVFFNNPVDSSGEPSEVFIRNATGEQLAFIFSVEGEDIAFFQVLDATCEVGAMYEVRVDVGESFTQPPLTYNPSDPNPPPNPDPALLGLRLFYVPSGGGRATLVERVVSADEMPNGDDFGVLLVDLGTTSEPLSADHPAIGRPLGVEIYPVLGFAGTWTLDNVRVSVDCLGDNPVGDADASGLVDLRDAAALQNCFTDSGGDPSASCDFCTANRLDADADTDIDLDDVAAFTASLLEQP